MAPVDVFNPGLMGVSVIVVMMMGVVQDVVGCPVVVMGVSFSGLLF